MRITETKKLLDLFYKAKVTPLLIGRHGNAKSEIPLQYAKENGFTPYVIYCGQIADPGDLTGLPVNRTDENGLFTDFAAPILLPRDPNEKALIIFDELNRADRHVINALFQLVLKGQIGTYKLPKDSQIIAIANPPTDEYTVNGISDSAFTDRFCHIKVELTSGEWVNYTKDAGDELSALFIKSNPEFLQDLGSHFDLKYIKPSPRSHSMLGALEKVGLIDSEHYLEVAAGLIGIEAAAAKSAFIQANYKRVSLANLLKAKDLTKPLAVLEKQPDQLNLVLKEIEGQEFKPDFKKVDRLVALYLITPKDLFAAHVNNLITGSKFDTLALFSTNEELERKFCK